MGSKFVIIAARRTGSNWLCAQLRAQQEIWCHGEVFHPDRIWIRTPNENDPFGENYEAELRAIRAANRDEFLKRIFELSFGREHVGFKIFPEHGDGEVIRLAENAEFAKIVLYRENFLAVYASLLAALQTGAYSAAEMLRVRRPLVNFSGDQFLEWHSEYAKFYSSILKVLHGSGQSFHVIRYGELNSVNSLNSVLRFIGTEHTFSRIETPSVRGPSDILSRFSNPQAVDDCLRECGFADWLEEPDV